MITFNPLPREFSILPLISLEGKHAHMLKSTIGTKSVKQMRGDLYHNAVAGPCGEVNVVWVAGHTAIPSLNVAGHVLTHRVYALTGTVGACGRFMWRQYRSLKALAPPEIVLQH